MSEETFDFYKDLTEMESILRNDLQQVQISGQSLKEWARNLVLSPGMAATRKAAISLQGLYVTHLKGGFRFFQTRLFSPQLQQKLWRKLC